VTYLPPVGSGPPLVYVPGLDGSGELLFAQEPELARRYRLLRTRSRADRTFGYADLVDDVAAALDAEKVERATILGESFGGTVALRFALAHPERVARLVLVSTFAYFSNRRLLGAGLFLCRRLSPAAIFRGKGMVDLYALALDGVPREVRGRLVNVTRRQPPDGYVRRVELVAEHDVRDRLGEIVAPTLVVAGERDRLVPPEHARELAGRLPNATLRLFDCAGHACLVNPAFSLATAIEEWERSTAARRSAAG
jgi:pimeloyl-ACP methyl ester carboxylesterase